MTVFEIVYQMDAVIGMMYLGADNSSVDCEGTLAIHSYSLLHKKNKNKKVCMICFYAIFVTTIICCIH